MAKIKEFPGFITRDRQAFLFKLRRYKVLERRGIIWMFARRIGDGE